MQTKVNIGYTLHGKGEQKVIALHDWMGGYINWEGATPFLDTAKYTYAFMEVRGYGKSKAIQGQYNSDEIAGDIFNLADDLGWDQFHLVGHSMTGMAVQKALLLDTANRIKCVVAVTPVSAAGFPLDEDTLKFFEAVVTDEPTAAMAYGAMTSNQLSDNWNQWRAHQLHHSADKIALKGYLKMWLNENFLEKVKGSEKPIFVLYGEEDHPRFREDAQKEAFGHYKNVTFEGIAKAGHYPMQQVPVYTISAIENYLSNISSRS